MNNITKLFEDVSTESFNKIDDEGIHQATQNNIGLGVV